MSIKDQLEAIYNQQLLGKTINKIDIYMIADEYVEYDSGKVWLTEGGVEFKFLDDSQLAFTYEMSDEKIEFLCVPDSILPFIADFDYYTIEIESDDFASAHDQLIDKVDIHWSDLSAQDYTGVVDTGEKIATGFILTLANGTTIQIASVDAKLNAETHQFAVLDYQIEGTILISFNHIFDIK